MSNASHRHAKAGIVKTPRIPWGHAAAVVVLIGALFAGVMLAAALAGPPAAADYVMPALAAAKVTDSTRHLTAVSSDGMGINPAAIAAPVAGPVGMARTMAATVDHDPAG